jgi:hypothetical protein
VFYHNKKIPFSFRSLMEQPIIQKNLFAPKDVFLEPPPSKLITASGYELHPIFGGQAYDHQVSTTGGYPKLS